MVHSGECKGSAKREALKSEEQSQTNGLNAAMPRAAELPASFTSFQVSTLQGDISLRVVQIFRGRIEITR